MATMSNGYEKPRDSAVQERERNWGKESSLKQELSSLQIFMIVISAVIGTGIFSGDGEALSAAGPGGLMVALLIVGVIAIFMLEGLSELIQLYPAPNALVEYVKYFVDEDLAYVVGVFYWYSWAATFQIQTSTGANFASFWGINVGEQVGCFYLLWPIVVCAINLAPVKVFGNIELIGGVLKLIMMTVIILIMFYLAGREGNAPKYLQDGFQSDLSQTQNWAAALCLVVAYVAFSFEGIEVIGVTAFEARSLQHMRRPSKILGYIIVVVYLVYAFSEICTISWSDPDLAHLSFDVGQTNPINPNQISPILILAAKRLNYYGLGSAFTAILIYSGMSSSNIALYVSSRTLYGLFGSLSHKHAILKNLQTENSRGVPVWCVLISAFAFWWIPFSQLSNSTSTLHLIQIMSVSTSTACIFVWAAICLAYLRYYWWSEKARDQGFFDQANDRVKIYSNYDREAFRKYSGLTFLSGSQPYITGIAFVGSLVILYIFTTALWWNSRATVPEVISLYAVPILAPTLWLSLKLYRYISNGYRTEQEQHKFQRSIWWVEMNDVTILRRIIDTFQDIKTVHTALEPDSEKNRLD